MKTKIEIIPGLKSEPIDGPWRWYHCEYSLDSGKTWLDGEVQGDGHAFAEQTLTDNQGFKIICTTKNTVEPTKTELSTA